MNKNERDRELRDKVEQQARRLKKAEQERHNWISQTVYIGTLGLAFVIPVVAGAYLGRWLDEQLQGYSTGWTVSLIFVGVVIGAFNVYFQLRE